MRYQRRRSVAEQVQLKAGAAALTFELGPIGSRVDSDSVARPSPPFNASQSNPRSTTLLVRSLNCAVEDRRGRRRRGVDWSNRRVAPDLDKTPFRLGRDAFPRS